jgi:hemolysin activation/secretion protein
VSIDSPFLHVAGCRHFRGSFTKRQLILEIENAIPGVFPPFIVMDYFFCVKSLPETNQQLIQLEKRPGELMRLIQSQLGRLAAALALLSAPVFAQTPPDAGSLLREQPKPPAVVPVQPPPLVPEGAAQEPDAGPRILVKGFRIQGALLISETELLAQLQDVVGQELSFTQLQGVAARLISYYSQRGYLARVFLPPQDVKNGIVTLQVIEGKRGSLRLNGGGGRLDSSRIQRFIDSRLGAGEAMDLARLGEALEILNEQPGVTVRSSLAPGTGEAEIDLVVSAIEKPLLARRLSLNNYGSRGTGAGQLTASLGLANPSGRFDSATLMANVSEGSRFAYADYSLAVGDSGLRLGLNASYLDYRLTQSSFAALGADGTARTLGLSASYPLSRRFDLKLSLTGNLDDKILIDNTVAGETGNRHVTVATLGLNGAKPEADGTWGFGLKLLTGQSDQRNAGALATDLASRRVQGHFTKLGYDLSYLRPLSEDWTLTSVLRGQLADKNLDSTERMSLGGPSAIRAYPVGEASGDQAWLLTLNAARKLGEDLALNLFVDAGGVEQNRNTWATWNAGNPRLPNHYQLAGVGVGVDWRLGPVALLSASIAAPLGNNPGRDINNKNADGSKQDSPRGWISLTAQF